MKIKQTRNLSKIYTSNYCVAYLDILGTKNIISEDKNDNYLNTIKKYTMVQ